MFNKKIVVMNILFILLSIAFLYNQNIKILLVKTGSMEKEIQVGDLLIIKKAYNYEIGDIITYETNDKILITHRIIRKQKESYITKGDNNNTADEEAISFKQIKGKVFLNIGNIKKISLYFIIFILIYIFYFLYKFQHKRM